MALSSKAYEPSFIASPLPGDDVRDAMDWCLDGWSALASGRAHVVRAYSDSFEHHLELAAGGTGRVLVARARAFLEQIMLGSPQKVVAAEHGRSVSTVAFGASQYLRALGLPCSVSEVPMPVVMLFHSHGRRSSTSSPLAWRLARTDAGTVVMSARRPDACLRHVLSSSIREVVERLVDGLSYVEIAALRATAVRTVANQIAAAYRMLGVSGRLSLLCDLITRRELGVRAGDVIGRREAEVRLFPCRGERPGTGRGEGGPNEGAAE